MPVGKIKWFNVSKGYGFIAPEDGGKDIFVHYTSIEGEGFRSLKDGEAVEFELVESDKGLQAHHVRRAKEASSATSSVPPVRITRSISPRRRAVGAVCMSDWIDATMTEGQSPSASRRTSVNRSASRSRLFRPRAPRRNLCCGPCHGGCCGPRAAQSPQR